ncbi:MAG: hypothetical protein ABSG69_13985 [Candidatus Acidiferrum sp.]
MKSWRLTSLLLGAGFLLAASTPSVLGAQDDKAKKSGDLNAGITISAQATAKEVGLPIYPGAKAHKEAGDDSDAANLGLWGGSIGFKLVVLKLESADAPDKVAAFYRKALAKYGAVLDCRNSQAGKAADKSSNDDTSGKLTCGDDKPDAGGQLFKAGSKEKQHIVGIKPLGGGSDFQLIYVEVKGTEHEAL